MQLAAILFQIQCIPFIFIVDLQYKLNNGCWSRYGSTNSTVVASHVTYRTGQMNIKKFALVACKIAF